MTDPRPCPHFTPPPPGWPYKAYCRCGFSRSAHEHWDEWTAAADSEATDR